VVRFPQESTVTLRQDTIAVRGREIEIWRAGAGHPLLFLHDAWTYRWLPIHDHLAAHYDVVLPIHPGFTGSSGFEEMDRIEDLVFHYLDLIEVMGLERPILMGTSLGGWIASEFAIRYAGMLRALILLDPLGLRLEGAPTIDLFQLTPAQTRAALFSDATAPLAHELVPDTPPPESTEAMLKARQAFARFAWQFADNPKLAGYLYRIKCPTLIVWGEADGAVPVTHGHLYQAEVAAARLVVLPAAGHLPHVEQPVTVANTVLEFLEQR
jgi:pimeloyl-ACP methyl ester carboxylesterase